MPGSVGSESNPGRCALLLVDAQQDFFERPGLSPSPVDLIGRLCALLNGARACGWSVLHVRTRISPDGSDRMPHWQRRDIRACVAGTAGYAPPPALAEWPGEPILHKRFFSAFGCRDLEARLKREHTQTLIVAGLYSHGCIRATALDAYERGFQVVVADDAVGSTEPVHAELSRAWLADRAASFRSVTELLAIGAASGEAPGQAGLASTMLDRQPAVADVCAKVAETGRDWAATDPHQRALMLERWAGELEQQSGDLVRLLAREIAKPVPEADDELRRMLAHIRAAARLARDHLQAEQVAGAWVRYRPLGSVALITPWNNPLAIAAGKLAPALACGNGCVWKPSPLAPECSERLLQALHAAGLPRGLVELVAGDAETVRSIVADTRIDAVSVTGSNVTGQAVAALCAARQIPLQAELGGNNAALILDDWTFDEAALTGLARSVFGFAGQRCTALRRLIVQRGILERFSEAFAAATGALHVGDPLDPAAAVGPLVSREHCERVQARLDRALADGAVVLAQARVPETTGSDPYAGRWLAPTLLGKIRPHDPIAQQESFGPLALILPADDLDEAIALANDVPQGLLAAVYSDDDAVRTRVAERVQAGMLKLAAGPLAVSAEAPFCGWKASAIGPPEHGLSDRDFYSRVQTLYT